MQRLSNEELRKINCPRAYQIATGMDKIQNWALVIGALIVDEKQAMKKPKIEDFNCPECWKSLLHTAKVEAVALKM